jgi:multicomponent Na+:H+ antiporter subunit E
MSVVSMFLLNLVLALLWTFMWGTFGPWVLLAGFVVGYLLLGLFSRAFGGVGYGAKLWDLLAFAAYFVRILVVANLQVAREIITPGHHMTPRLLRYPVEDLTAAQLTVFANSITLTPGTLSVDVSDDDRYLYVHAMYARDRDLAMRDLTELRGRILRDLFGQ